MSWEKVKLGEACSSIYDGDHNAPPKVDDGIPFITISNIDTADGSIDFSSAAHVPQSYYESLKSERRAQPGDVLYSVVGSFGIPSLVKEAKPFVFQRHVAILRPGERITSEYLYYLMKSRDFYHWADSVAIGAAQRTVTLGQLREKTVSLPPLPIQRRIAGVLSAYDKLIENNRKQIKLLEEAAQRLYKEWFVDLRFPGHETTPIHDGLPEGWNKLKLPELADVTYGFAFDASCFNDAGNGVPIVRIRNIPTGYSNDYTTQIADNKYRVEAGDLLVGMDGDFYINRWYGDNAWLVQRSCRIRAKDPAFDGLIEWSIKAPIAALQRGIVGSTVAHLGKKHLDNIVVVTPGKRLLGIFNEITGARIAASKQIAAAREARDRLLPKLMSGEIEV